MFKLSLNGDSLIADIKFYFEDLIVNLSEYTRFTIDTKNFVKRLKKILIITLLTLSGNAKAYIADRCDWLDCEAMATGTNEGSGFRLLIVVVIGVIIFFASSK